MTSPPEAPRPAEPAPAAGREPDAPEPDGRADEAGTTVIADLVVAKIAALAAREVGGVWGLGGTGRMVGALRERIPGTRLDDTQGVAVEVGSREAAVDLTLVAEYGVAIQELADAVRENVVAAVEGMTGLVVTEVNIAVADVRLPGDAREPDAESEPADPDPRPRVR